MSIRREQNIRDIVQRFEVAFLGFIEHLKSKEPDINETYFSHAIAKAARSYAREYIANHAFIHLLGSSNTPNLSSIYVPQRFQPHTSIRSFESVEELEEAFSMDLQRSSYSKGNNLLGLNLANEEAYLTVLGKPATGKTTFLQYIGLEALRYPEGKYRHDVLPVFLQMWKVFQNTDTLLQAIAEEFEQSGFPESRELALWMLTKGKLLIIIDGLNESVLSQKYLSQTVQEFVKSFPKNRYIVSSRLSSYQNSLGQFLEVVLQPWSDLHIQEYIHKWFAIVYATSVKPSDESSSPSPNIEQDLASIKAQRCWKILQTNSVAKELAHSPLSLLLLCLLYDHQYSFPSNISSLYQKAVKIILEEQVLKCQSLNDELENGISTDVLDLVLMEIAYKGFEFSQTVIATEEVEGYIQVVLNSCTNILRKIASSFVLKTLQQLGICRVISWGTSLNFVFSHITFQEYFVARYIYTHSKVKQIVPYHLSDRRWQEVFMLLAGMMIGNTEELLLCMQSQANNYINTERLREILDWIDQVSFRSKGDLKSVAKRIAALLLARPRFLNELAPALILTRMLGLIRDLYNAFDSSLNFDKVLEADLSMSLAYALDLDSATELQLTIQLCNNLEQTLASVNFDSKYINFLSLSNRLESLSSQAPSYDQPFEVREEFRNKISRTWFQTLYLPVELNRISHREVEALENYLYVNLLIVQCKNMAIAVSLKTWEEIESRILRCLA